MRKVLTGILLIGFLNSFGQGNIYWAESGANPKIRKADIDGANSITLVGAGLSSPRGVAVDTVGGKIYWIDEAAKRIQRANLNDGSNVENLIDTGLSNPFGIALDVQGGKMYWTDYGTKKVQRANLDGTNTEDLVTGLNKPLGIALDTIADKIYWVDNLSKRIWRADFDGSGSEIVMQEIVGYACENPYNVMVDVLTKDIYWTEENKVWRDNGNLTTIANNGTGIYYSFYNTVDLGALKVYVTDSLNNTIKRFNIDGSNMENLTTSIGSTINPQGIAVVGDIAIGVDDVKEKEAGVKVYPNPARDKVIIEGLQGTARLTVYDGLGRVVIEAEINGKTAVNVQELEGGVYYYRVSQYNKIITGKIIKL